MEKILRKQQAEGEVDIHKIENKYMHTGFLYPWYCEEAEWFMRANNYMLGNRPL